MRYPGGWGGPGGRVLGMRYPRGRVELGGRAEARGVRYPRGRAELEQFKKRREIRNGVKSITVSIDSL